MKLANILTNANPCTVRLFLNLRCLLANNDVQHYLGWVYTWSRFGEEALAYCEDRRIMDDYIETLGTHDMCNEKA